MLLNHEGVSEKSNQIRLVKWKIETQKGYIFALTEVGCMPIMMSDPPILGPSRQCMIGDFRS